MTEQDVQNIFNKLMGQKLISDTSGVITEVTESGVRKFKLNIGNDRGWISAPALTYVNATQMTCVGNYTDRIGKGTRLKLVQTSQKYFPVYSSSYSTGTDLTTITILANTSYTLASAAISLPYYSNENPVDWPGWFAMAAPTWTVSQIDNGSGGQPTTSIHFARIDKDEFRVKIYGSGVKAGAAWYFSYAIPAAYPTVSEMSGSYPYVGGSANAMGSGWDRIGLAKVTSTVVYLVFDSTTNIPDNVAMSQFSADFSYKI